MYSETRLGRKVVEAGYTLKSASEKFGVRKQDLSNYLNGHRGKVGREKRHLIRLELVKLGFLKPRVKRIPVCQRCGLQYPTKRI